MTERGRVVRLRGTSVVAAPLVVLAVITLSMAVATAAWGAWGDQDLGIAFWAMLAALMAVGTAALIAIRGCFVEVDGADGLRDVVGWVTARRVEQHRIRTARVRAGVWRLYELELDDDRRVLLLGASPLQFPARLLPDAMARDLADLDVILNDKSALDHDGQGNA